MTVVSLPDTTVEDNKHKLRAMILPQTAVCGILLLARGIVGPDSKVVNPVRIGEFKFIGIVKLNDKFKCLAVLVSNKHVLTPCDCVGYFVDAYLYKYYFPHHLKVVAGSVHAGKDGSEDEGDAQTRTPYVTRKHPQCMPYTRDGADQIKWIMYNYGLITVSFPFNSDYRVAPIIMTSEITLKGLITDLIKTQGECKTVSFPIEPTNASWISTHLEWSHVQLKPTVQCEEEMCSTNSPYNRIADDYDSSNDSSNDSLCLYDEYYFFGKFCGTERFLKARDACFNNSGAPVICGGTYMGHLGDVIVCPKTRKGRFFMYTRFDWAVPFIIQSSAVISKPSILPCLVLLAGMKLWNLRCCDTKVPSR